MKYISALENISWNHQCVSKFKSRWVNLRIFYQVPSSNNWTKSKSWSGNVALNRLVTCLKCMELACWVLQASLELYYYLAVPWRNGEDAGLVFQRSAVRDKELKIVCPIVSDLEIWKTHRTLWKKATFSRYYLRIFQQLPHQMVV